jgi:acyl-CoA synthetase (NDP forming)
VIALYAPSLGGTAAEVRAALDSASGAHPDVSIAACFYGGAPRRDPDDDKPSVPVYDAVDRAARALGRVAQYAGWLQEEPGTPHQLPEEAAARARGIVAAALARGADRLEVDEACEVLAAAGVAVVPTASVHSVDEAALAAAHVGYPVALKAAGRNSTAKTVAAGLALDLADELALRGAWARMAERFVDGLAPALVQPMVEPGVDVAVVVHGHPEVGPVISLRPGGANAALDQDAEVRVLPLGDEEAVRLVERSRLAPYLEPASSAALQDLLLRIGALVEEVPEVVGLRANPVIVGAEQAVAIEVAVDIADVVREPLPPVRHV